MRLADDCGPTNLGFCAIGLAILLALGGLILALFGLGWHAQHVDCLRLHEQTGYATRMTGTMWGGGCYVHVDGRWIPDTRYRMVDVN